RTGLAGKDHRAPMLPDRGQYALRSSPEEGLFSRVRPLERFPPIRLVRAGGPHEIAAVAVNVHGKLDVRMPIDERNHVPALRFRQLSRAGVHLTQAITGGAAKSVEEGTDRVIPIDIHPPLVAQPG